MPAQDLGQRVAMLWQLSLDGNHVSCAIYRQDGALQLRLESPSTVILVERFNLQPRVLSRAHALRKALARRGWQERYPDGPPSMA